MGKSLLGFLDAAAVCVAAVSAAAAAVGLFYVDASAALADGSQRLLRACVTDTMGLLQTEEYHSIARQVACPLTTTQVTVICSTVPPRWPCG